MAGRGEATEQTEAPPSSRSTSIHELHSDEAAKTDWGRWCHVNMPPPPPPDDEYFTIDISRDSPEQHLGFQVDLWKHAKGLLVIAVRQSPMTPIGDWNERCWKWFPRDELRVSDVILQVNDEKARGANDEKARGVMVEELKSAKDVLMVVLREGSCG